MAQLIIATHFKRPNAPIDLPNKDGTFTRYFFRPVDPKNPDSEHVALVDDPAHQARLLAIAEGYYVAETQSIVENAAAIAAATIGKPTGNQPAPASAGPAPAAASAVAPVEPVAPSTNGSENPPLPPEPPALTPEMIANDAAALLSHKLSAFKESAKKASPAVLAEALRLESAKTDDDQRATVIKELKHLLKV